MKKLIYPFLTGIILGSVVTTVVACTIGETSTIPYISSLKDYDWANGSTGWDLNSPTTAIDHELDLNNLSFQNSGQSIKPDYSGSYFNYDKMETNFKENGSLLKQAVTGAPINKIYSGGNSWADFGVTSKARIGLKANTILNWNTNNDLDFEYGKSSKKIQARTKTALKALETQDERIAFGDIRDHSRTNGSFQNTNNGTKNPFEKTISNFQYRDYIFDWGQHGNISPPAADVIEAGHTNGTPVFGLIFLSGYGGLQRDEIKDLIEKNQDGTYKLVDILIDMALTFGFDGWFFNDEANGGWPDGSITPPNFAYDIAKQYYEKTKNSQNEDAKKLELIYYRDGGTLNSLNGTPTFGDFARLTEYADMIQTDFRVRPNTNNDYIIKNNLEHKKVHSLIELAGSYNFAGNIDWRQFVYGSTSEDDPEAGYNEDVYQSFTSFSGAGSGEFGGQAFQISNVVVDLNDYQTRLNSFIYSQQVANLFENYIFSGLNSFNSSLDYGSKTPVSQNIRQMIMADPRIDTASQKVDENDQIFRNLYDFETNEGYNSTSFGIGNIIQEYTILNDENFENQDNISTNFSLGNGFKMVDRDLTGQVVSSVKNYPWTNRRLTDVSATYNFDIREIGSKIGLPINKGLNGFYDYYDPYLKGNSLVIGNQLQMDGSVTEALWENKIYDWNIMGSNLQTGDYDVSFVVKADNAGSSLQDVIDNLKILTTYTSDGTNEYLEATTPKVSALKNGWYRILSKVSASNTKKIAKFGIRITPNSNSTFKFNVGEFDLTKSTISEEVTNLINFGSQMIIKRDAEKLNIRLNWESSNDLADYYQIYYKLDEKWYQVGETTIKNFFISNLPISSSNSLMFGIKPINKFVNSKKITTFEVKI